MIVDVKTTLRGGAALLALAAAQAAPLPAGAQGLPPALQRLPGANPDRINEEQRQRLQERANPELARPSTPQVDAPPPADRTERDTPEVRFTLTRIAFDRSDYLTPAELDAFAQPLIGREVTLGELQRVVDDVNALYARRGLTTARAVLPTQPVEGGVVSIRLVEGRIGGTTVEGAGPRTSAYVRRRAALPEGTLAAPAALEQRLRVFNTNNDAQLRARLAPGESFGRTDVVLGAREPARVSADVFSDNNGFASTGETEVGAVLRGYRLFSATDRLSAVFVASRGVRSGNLSLSAPIGDRFRVSASASGGRTRVLFGQIAALGVRGTSLSLGGDVAALLLVGDRSTITATASVQASRSQTEISGQRVIENEALNVSAGIIASYAAPGFALSAQHQVTVARVDERLSGAHVAPVLWQGSALVAHAVGSGWQARLRGDWQLASDSNLPGILQYQIGGSRSSRAFAPGVAAGDRGLSVSAEMAYGAVAGGVQFEPFAFVDHAQTHAPGFGASLQSVGLGLAVSAGARAQLRVTGATSFHETGVDADSRAFFSATVHF